MITVYADVLVALNILITYIFLVCTRVFTRLPTNKWGVAIASLLGGISSIMIFFDNMTPLLSIILKLIFCCIIVLIGFFPDSLKCFLKALLSFFGITVLFGGAIYFLELTLNSHKILYINGTVYFDMDIKYLLGAVFLIYGVFYISNYFFERNAFKNELYKVDIYYKNSCVTLTGFVDTGNSLTDALTNRLVFIGELSSLSPLFTYEEILYFKGNTSENIPQSLQGDVRLIPALTIGDTHLLKAFTPDKTEIIINKKSKEIKNICIAVVNKKLSAGEYSLLLNKNAVDFER